MKHIALFGFVFLVLVAAGYLWSRTEVQAPASVEELPPAQEEAVSPADSPTVTNDDANKIIINAPTPDSDVTTPLTVSGEARGWWFFEATFPVTMLAGDGTLLWQGYATAEGDWMTEDFVPFTTTIDYTLPVGVSEQPARLVFYKANPSGLEENADTFEVPIVLH